MSWAEKIYFVENIISKHQTTPGEIEDEIRKILMKVYYKKNIGFYSKLSKLYQDEIVVEFQIVYWQPQLLK